MTTHTLTNLEKIKKVSKSDTRPNGKPDECFYCNEKIGGSHKFECVCNDHKVKVRYSFEVEIEMPRSWNKFDIEFNRNEGSWCANNAIGELKEMSKKHCLCPVFLCEVIDKKLL